MLASGVLAPFAMLQTICNKFDQYSTVVAEVVDQASRLVPPQQQEWSESFWGDNTVSEKNLSL